VEQVEAVDQDEPIRVAICGRPNVGKSSLVNSIVGRERTIVSKMSGTTRDAIDTDFNDDDGQRFVLVDTAGIRKRAQVYAFITCPFCSLCGHVCVSGALHVQQGADLGCAERDVIAAQHHLQLLRTAGSCPPPASCTLFNTKNTNTGPPRDAAATCTWRGCGLSIRPLPTSVCLRVVSELSLEGLAEETSSLVLKPWVTHARGVRARGSLCSAHQCQYQTQGNSLSPRHKNGLRSLTEWIVA